MRKISLIFLIFISIAFSQPKSSGTVYNIVNYGIKANGVTDATKELLTLASVLNSGTTKKTLYFPSGTYRINSALTLDENITLRFDYNAKLIVADILTIDGSIDAGLYQIFDTTGTIDLNNAKIKEAYVEWFGAKGDTTTNDRVAFQKLADALGNGGNIVLNSTSTYRISQGALSEPPVNNYYGIRLKSNTTLDGNGATLMVRQDSIAFLFSNKGYDWGEYASTDFTQRDSNVVIKNLNVIKTATNSTTYILRIGNMNSFIMENCNIKGDGFIIGDVIGGVNHFTFQNNYFDGRAGLWLRPDSVTTGSNTIQNVFINNNYIKGYQDECIGLYSYGYGGSLHDVKIENNTLVYNNTFDGGMILSLANYDVNFYTWRSAYDLELYNIDINHNDFVSGKQSGTKYFTQGITAVGEAFGVNHSFRNINISYNHFDIHGLGIYVNTGASWTVDHNYFTNSGDSVYVSSFNTAINFVGGNTQYPNGVISNNVVKNWHSYLNLPAINVSSQSIVDVIDNIVDSAKYGGIMVVADGTTGNKVIGNTVTNAGGAGITVSYGKGHIVTNNTSSRNNGMGIFLYNSPSSIIAQNSLSYNTYPIFTQLSDSSLITVNTILRNSLNPYISPAELSTIFFHNMGDFTTPANTLGDILSTNKWGNPKSVYYNGVDSYASLAYTTKTQGVELYFYPTAFYNTLFYFGINMTVWVDNAGKLKYGSAITGTTSYVNEKADSILTLNKWNHILIKFDEITPTTCKIMFDDSTTYANGEVALFRLFGKK